MGWNSWNTIQKDINEKLIMDIADVMVSSGRHYAGYEYLVLDDAWMAAETQGKKQRKSPRFDRMPPNTANPFPPKPQND